MNKINALGLFSGGGGLDLGFSAAGFNTIFSSDIDRYSCQTLEKNQDKKKYLGKHPVVCEDIRNISYKSIKSDLSSADIDFIIGGPPCQAFSVFGRRRGLDDPRGNLVFEYARIIKEMNPEAFLFENVAGLKTIHNGSLYNEILETLSLGGKYAISSHEYELADFGIPQFRKRIFLIGTKSGKKIPQMEPTHTSSNLCINTHKPFNTVESVLSNLPTPITDWKGIPYINGHVGRKHSAMIIERYKELSFGERDPKTRINKLNPDKPSFTIVVGSDAGGGKGHIHPFEARELTPRESARIQTFPDWWEFSGTGRHIIRQVGNAVPPLFASILGRYIARELFGCGNIPKFDELIKKLELNFLSNGNQRLIQS
ncbi:DNA cytosine methyltransferase [Pseudanabaena galeata UHCC 0370]|uniref:Cytosine-specific methyltransferase n=1 Tax=Pseudanabaena galeata UHCC 0370 TaxID=3110310 RepID=A0ABU5TFP0_9CYAN|nr:DNA cytosine methyltransferase [Pseudanabaena galeata]MEA5476503.1 DNA cytosine methyltransferase [Pseudanabaena galeata UHCC 0370]